MKGVKRNKLLLMTNSTLRCALRMHKVLTAESNGALIEPPKMDDGCSMAQAPQSGNLVEVQALVDPIELGWVSLE